MFLIDNSEHNREGRFYMQELPVQAASVFRLWIVGVFRCHIITTWGKFGHVYLLKPSNLYFWRGETEGKKKQGEIIPFLDLILISALLARYSNASMTIVHAFTTQNVLLKCYTQIATTGKSFLSSTSLPERDSLVLCMNVLCAWK